MKMMEKRKLGRLMSKSAPINMRMAKAYFGIQNSRVTMVSPIKVTDNDSDTTRLFKISLGKKE